MKVTSPQMAQALRAARESYGGWTQLLAAGVRGADGVLRVPLTPAKPEDEKTAAAR